MTELKPCFIRNPFTLVKGRTNSIVLGFYESYDQKTGTGTGIDFTGYTFRCDFRYDIDDEDAVFSLESPDGVIVGDNILTLAIPQELTTSIPMPTGTNLAFPFATLVAELVAIDEDDKEFSIAFLTVKLFERVTR